MLQGCVYQRRSTGLTPLAGVRVSNGRELTATDARGRYTLPRWPEDRFVFVTTPAGYAAESGFFRDLTLQSDLDFIMRPDPPSRDPDFSFIQITDIHLQNRDDAESLKEDLAQITAELGDQARFIVDTGDMTDRGTQEQYALYLETVATCPLPIWYAVGNREYRDEPTEARGDRFMDTLGPTYYSFDYGPLHFVVCNTQAPKWPRPDHQETWLQADIAAAERPTILLIHDPLGTEFYPCLERFEILASLSGHSHGIRVVRSGSLVHYNSPPLCYGATDRSPRGYRLCTYRDGRFTTEFRNLDVTSGFRGMGAMPHPDNRLGEVLRQAGELPQPAGDWPFRGNARRTGAAAAGPIPPLALAWKAGTGGGILAGAPILAEGKVFVAVKREDQPHGNALLALDAREGRLLWRREVNAAVKLAPAYAAGRLTAVTLNGIVVQVDAATGEPTWSRQLGEPSAMGHYLYMSPLVHDDRVYVGMGRHFAALDASSGETVWERTFGARGWFVSYPSPAIAGEYLVAAFLGYPPNLHVLDPSTGATLWQNERRQRVAATPVVAKDKIYVVDAGTKVRAHDLETGEILWMAALDKALSCSSPALAGDSLIVPSGAGTLHSLDAETGEERWVWHGGEGLVSVAPLVRGGPGAIASPTIAGDTIYVGSADGKLYAVGLDTGTETWRHDLCTPTLSAPAVSGSGLWTCATDGFVYAFSGATAR